MLDYLILNANIYDGTGHEPYRADVAISRGKISAIGKITGRASETIDATGLSLSPGFIDTHAHSDEQLFMEPSRASKLRQGITTEVNGQCGFSRAPLLPGISEEALDYLITFQSKPPERIPFFEAFGEFMRHIAQMGIGANQACFVGHNVIRASVIGMENRPATPAEMEWMKSCVREAMQSGSFGLSSGLVYAPGCYASPEELMELAEVAAQYGGIYTSHIRSEADGLLESVGEVIGIAREVGITANIAHIKALFSRNYDKLPKALAMIEQANGAGCNVFFDAYPYTACSTMLLNTLPPSYLSHGIPWLAEHLSVKKNVEALRRDIYEPMEKWENPIPEIGFDGIMVVEAPLTPEANGKTIAAYAMMRGVDAMDAYAELLARNKGNVTDVRFAMSEENIELVYGNALCTVGTDGIYYGEELLSHPRSFGSFPRYLGRYVRDRKILPFAEGIRRVTGLAADHYRLAGKGYIKTGFDADLALFDFDALIDNADYYDPMALNSGLKKVWVNGKLAIEDNEERNVRNGRVLRFA